MNTDTVVKAIIANAEKPIDLSMFSPEQRAEIFSKVAEILFKQGKTAQAIAALEKADVDLSEKLEPIAKYYFEIGEYETACLLYEKLNKKELVEFMRQNLLKK